MKNPAIKFSLLTTISLFTLLYAQAIVCKAKQEHKTEDVEEADSWEDIFSQMHKNFAKMQQRMDEDLQTMSSRMGSAFDQEPMPTLSIAGDDKALIITLGGVDGKNIEATTHDNERLTIKAAGTTLEITVHDHMLHAQMVKERNDKEEKDGAKKQFASFSQAETYQSVTHELDLDNAKVQFEEKDKNLVITIQALPEKQGKALSVEVIKTQKDNAEK